MSAKPLPVELVAQENEEDDPVAAAFDNAPFMEATPAMPQAVAQITDADRAVLDSLRHEDIQQLKADMATKRR